MNILEQDAIRQVVQGTVLDDPKERLQGSCPSGLLAGVREEDTQLLVSHSSEGTDPDWALSVAQLVYLSSQPATLRCPVEQAGFMLHLILSSFGQQFQKCFQVKLIEFLYILVEKCLALL